jgi:uncharacterized protein (DUF3820 family)
MENDFRPEILKELLVTPMPFGKYKGVILAEIPTFYLEWFAMKGFPKGKLGMQLATMFEIRTNGLDYLLEGIKKMMRN